MIDGLMIGFMTFVFTMLGYTLGYYFGKSSK